MHKYRTREHEGVAAAWAAFARDCGCELPRAAAIGVAAPIEGDVLRFVNSDWAIDRAGLAGELGLDRLLLLNDFGAVAQAVAVLPAGAFERLAGPDAALGEVAVTSVIGPGTGLGVSILLRRGGAVEVIETEAAHIAFAPRDESQAALAAAIEAEYGRASVERIVSGPGLLDIHAHLGGREWDVHEAAGLWAAAVDGSDPVAARALDLLVACFGAAAGDIALAHGAMAVVITGGLANRMRAALAGPRFREPFVAKGRYRARMARVPVALLTYAEPGLFGAAVAFGRERV